MPETGSLIQIRLFDGRRQLIVDDRDVLVTITDGWQNQVCRQDYPASKLAATQFSVKTFSNAGDLYSVVAYVGAYKQVGFYPVHVTQSTLHTLDLMLVPNDASFNFALAKWDSLATTQPNGFELLNAGSDAVAARQRYEGFIEDPVGQRKIACFWNLMTAMSQIHLPQGTPVDYLRQIIWDDPDLQFAQDRFFAWATPALVSEVKQAAQEGEFAPEFDPSFFHGDATCSFKQVQFGEANVQLTFHEHRTAKINGEDCIVVEPDIDYYKDLGAHALFEVIPNAVTHSLTDPREVYVLRWIAGRHAGVPEFNPPYWLV